MLGVAVSAALLYWAMRGLRLADVVEHIRGVRPLPLLLCAAVALLTFPMRALRWQVLLRLPDGRPLPFRASWHAVAIAYMANNLLPLRAGEVLRAYAASKLAPVRVSTGLASVAVERVFDALTVVAMFVVALLSAGFSVDQEIGGLRVADVARRTAIVAALGLAAATTVLTWPQLAERLIRRVVPWSGLSARLVTLLHGVREGIAALRSPARLAALVLWCVGIWIVNALSFQVLFPAFGIDTGWTGPYVVQGVIVLFIAVPSMPGFIGVFEAAIVVALALYGVPQDAALACALTYHAINFLPITLIGLWSAARTHIGLRPATDGR